MLSCFVFAGLLVTLCVCVCCIDSTTRQITSGMPSLSCRVINNWPFVPFLPRLFLSSLPNFLLSSSLSPPSLSPFFSFHLPLSLSPHFYLSPPSTFYYSPSFFFVVPLAFCVSSSDTLLSSCAFLCPPFPSVSFSPSQVIVETLCPTFTETAPLLMIPQWLISMLCVGVCVCA